MGGERRVDIPHTQWWISGADVRAFGDRVVHRSERFLDVSVALVRPVEPDCIGCSVVDEPATSGVENHAERTDERQVDWGAWYVPILQRQRRTRLVGDARRRGGALYDADALWTHAAHQSCVTVGAPAFADVFVEVRQRPGVASANQQLGSAHGTCAEEQPVAGDGASTDDRGVGREDGHGQGVPSVRLLRDGRDLVARMDRASTGRFRRCQVVLRQIELCAIGVSEIGFAQDGRWSRSAVQFRADGVPVPDSVDAGRGVPGAADLRVPHPRVCERSGGVDLVRHGGQAQFGADARVVHRGQFVVGQGGAEHGVEVAAFRGDHDTGEDQRPPAHPCGSPHVDGSVFGHVEDAAERVGGNGGQARQRREARASPECATVRHEVVGEDRRNGSLGQRDPRSTMVTDTPASAKRRAVMAAPNPDPTTMASEWSGADGTGA